MSAFLVIFPTCFLFPLLQSLNKSSKMLNFINARMRVTVQDSRVLVGTFMAFDKHMNIVLGDCEEQRRVRVKKGTNGSGAEEVEERRQLGLVLLRGENVVSIQIEALPKSVKTGPAGGPGAAVAAGRGAPMMPPGAMGVPMGAMAGMGAAPMGLAGPVRGVGGPAPGAMMGGEWWRQTDPPAAAGRPFDRAVLSRPPNHLRCIISRLSVCFLSVQAFLA